MHEGVGCKLRAKHAAHVGGTGVAGCAGEGGNDGGGGRVVDSAACGNTVNVVHALVPVFAPRLVLHDDLLDVVGAKSKWGAAAGVVQTGGLGKMASPSYCQTENLRGRKS